MPLLRSLASKRDAVRDSGEGGVFLGAGMWHPDAQAHGAVRRAIDEDPKGWKRIRDAKRFGAEWELAGDSLKRPPRGYAADHPMIDDLRRKDHIAVSNLTKKDVTRADLVDFVAGRFDRASAYMGWLAEATGMAF